MKQLIFAAVAAVALGVGCSPEPEAPCVEVGKIASRNQDCCAWRADAGEVLEQICYQTCKTNADCASGCCHQAPAPTVAGHPVCQPIAACQ